MDRISLLLLSSNLSKQFFNSIRSNLSSTARSYSNTSRYPSVPVGVENTRSFRIYLKNRDGAICSPFHDVPLFANKSEGLLNMVVEIPRWTQAKMEINKAERFNPIVQDVKNGQLRFVNNVFPYHGYIWNYGALPQTWEDPDEKCETTGMKGDNDPLDVCEIGSQVLSRGAVVTVKVLGALGLIDEGEADWKILAVNVDDPLSSRLNDVDDVKKHMPGLVEASADWFRIYKIPTGKPANTIANGGQFYSAEFARKLILHDHEMWRRLIRGDKKGSSEKARKISLAHTSELGVESARSHVEDARRVVEAEIEKLKREEPDLNQMDIDQVHYVDRTK